MKKRSQFLVGFLAMLAIVVGLFAFKPVGKQASVKSEVTTAPTITKKYTGVRPATSASTGSISSYSSDNIEVCRGGNAFCGFSYDAEELTEEQALEIVSANFGTAGHLQVINGVTFYKENL